MSENPEKAVASEETDDPGEARCPGREEMAPEVRIYA